MNTVAERLRLQLYFIVVQAQQGVQRKLFGELEDLVQYYSQPRRGLVCGLTTPISQQKEEEPEDELESGGCHVTVM